MRDRDDSPEPIITPEGKGKGKVIQSGVTVKARSMSRGRSQSRARKVSFKELGRDEDETESDGFVSGRVEVGMPVDGGDGRGRSKSRGPVAVHGGGQKGQKPLEKARARVSSGGLRMGEAGSNTSRNGGGSAL